MESLYCSVRPQNYHERGSFLAEIRRCIKRILTNPEIGRLLDDEVRRKTLHRFPYSLLYVQESSRITILAVVHQKRRPNYWRDRL